MIASGNEREDGRWREKALLTGGCSTLGGLDGLCPLAGVGGDSATHVSLIPIRILTIESLIVLS